MRLPTPVVLFTLFLACASDPDSSDAGADAGLRDAGSDAGGEDARLRDAGLADAEPPDAAIGPDANAGPDAADGIPRPSEPGDDPALLVQLWNGHTSAASFTFDDAYSSQLDFAAPALDARGVAGTFFVVCNNAERRRDEWAALGAAHELANHTVSHQRAADADASEVTGCDSYIRNDLGAPVFTLAYPFGQAGGPYTPYSEVNYVAARGTSRGLVHVEDEVDWTRTLSYVSGPAPVAIGTPIILAAFEQAEDEEAWITITHHAIEADDGFAPIPVAELESMVDLALSLDMWIDTYGNVATYLRGHQGLVSSTPEINAGTQRWEWTVPPGVTDIPLRVIVRGGSLAQNGRAISWNGAEGYYPVDIAAGELTWTPEE